MEHRGKLYTVVLSIGGKWKWSVEFDGHKSGFVASRPMGIARAKGEIDKALTPKKLRLRPPTKS
jgi:hypothetical protein